MEISIYIYQTRQTKTQKIRMISLSNRDTLSSSTHTLMATRSREPAT